MSKVKIFKFCGVTKGTMEQEINEWLGNESNKISINRVTQSESTVDSETGDLISCLTIIVWYILY